MKNGILVALDGSPRATDVLAAADGIARATAAKLWLFRAVGVPTELPPEALSVRPDAVPALLEAHARQELEVLARSVDAARVAGLRVKVGVPWQAICEAASEGDVDLIVIGSHGFGGLDRLLGTTAAKVVNHTDRSVLVVRQGGRLG